MPQRNLFILMKSGYYKYTKGIRQKVGIKNNGNFLSHPKIDNCEIQETLKKQIISTTDLHAIAAS